MSLRSAMEEGFKAAAERFKTADVSPLLLRAIRNALPGGIVGSFAADEGHRGSGAMRGMLGGAIGGELGHQLLGERGLGTLLGGGLAGSTAQQSGVERLRSLLPGG